MGSGCESSRAISPPGPPPTTPTADDIAANLHWGRQVAYTSRNHPRKDNLLYNMRRPPKPLVDLSGFIINLPITFRGPNTFRRDTIGNAISSLTDMINAMARPMYLLGPARDPWMVGREEIGWNDPYRNRGGDTSITFPGGEIHSVGFSLMG